MAERRLLFMVSANGIRSKLILFYALMICTLAISLAMFGCGARPVPAPKIANGKKKLPPAPTPATSGGNARAEGEPKSLADGKSASGGTAAGLATGARSPTFQGSTATISLPPPPLSERHDLLAGWIDLYDGVSTYGWTKQSKANWRAEGGMLTVSEGEPGLLTTNYEFGDYQLRVDFLTATETNSGVFLHTSDNPSREDITTRCYEVNIAPDSNPFPTGSIVGRAKADHSVALGQWRSLEAKVQGGRVLVFVDGQLTADYTDPRPLRRGKIGLQFNTGSIQFREVKIRPLGLGLFGEAGGQSGWKLDPHGKSALEVGIDGDFRLRGGKGYLESDKQFKDFILQVEARTNHENQNSGIFFRTMPGSEMNGYECQVNNAAVNEQPVDYGTGGIFNRQKARVMPAPDGKWFALTIICEGPRMGCWVNGTQVSDWVDDRKEDPNPRKGKRLERGTIQLQGHDEKTDVNFRLFRVGELPVRVEPAAQ